MASSKSGSSFVERRFSFYAAYHQNGINQAIHVACVPVIFATALIMTNLLLPLENFIPSAAVSALTNPIVPINTALFFAVLYSSYYLFLSVRLGASVLPLLVSLLCIANYASESFPRDTVLTVAVAAHVVAWLLQFYGHGVHEGRAPALLDSFFESMAMAPMFIWLEVGFYLGFWKQFKSRVDASVAARHAEWKAEAAKAE